MRMEVAGDIPQLRRLVVGVVHVLDEDELERDHPPVPLGESAHRRKQLSQRIGAVHRHDALPHLVGRAME